MKMSFNMLTHILSKMTFPPQKTKGKRILPAALVHAITVEEDCSFQAQQRTQNHTKSSFIVSLYMSFDRFS